MQKQVSKPTQDKTEQTGEITVSEESKQRAADLRSELDDLLDDIDSVLEENAETFIKHYVQRGGE